MLYICCHVRKVEPIEAQEFSSHEDEGTPKLKSFKVKKEIANEKSNNVLKRASN